MAQAAQPQHTPVCFAYGRHSTYKQGRANDALTETVQHDRCKDYYQRELAPKGVVWGGWFYDAAVSGGKTNFSERPHGRTVFATAQPGDHVVITRLDRGFRRLGDGISTLEQFEKRGVQFHSIFERIDTSTAAGIMVRNILLSIAQFKRDLDSERTKESIQYLKDHGMPYHRSPPMGWRIVVRGETRVLRVDKAEREFIDLLADANAKGASFNKLSFWCWSNASHIAMRRQFSSPDAIKHAIYARALGYPKVSGKKAICQMYREAVESGQV